MPEPILATIGVLGGLGLFACGLVIQCGLITYHDVPARELLHQRRLAPHYIGGGIVSAVLSAAWLVGLLGGL